MPTTKPKVKKCRPRKGNIDRGILEEMYHTEDIILPMSRLPDPCRVKILISNKRVILEIGQRDFEWDRKSKRFIGAGTQIGSTKILRKEK